ncbi:carbohydrate-binding module family 13 protein [Serpula lacrymans var. lacrymans S7.9]|nr:carbohydrate-binding module family 13 protein [Serpula lacrymans var. lacrymans S7.9]EGO20674.1 carbohydrate-binding module family 13 protein [Serpula lacrymans var. lacrymans S7.9]
MSLIGGIYSIENSAVPLAIDLSSGGSADGTKVQGWGKWLFSNPNCLAQLWLVTPTGATDAFTLQNLRGGLYLDLPNGSSANGNPLQGWQRVGNNQVWIIRQTGTFYKMQNLQGGSTCSLHSVLIALRAPETRVIVLPAFVNLLDGSSSNGTAVEGWAGEWNDTANQSQLWSFQPMSRTSAEVDNALIANPVLQGHFVNYQMNGIYWVLDKDLVKNIWAGANLGEGKKYTLRPELFDQDDFTLCALFFHECIRLSITNSSSAFKAQLAQWGSDNILANGLNLLLGVMLGVSTEEGSGGQSCNFFLDSDFSTVLFFDAQTGNLLDPGDITTQVTVGFF